MLYIFWNRVYEVIFSDLQKKWVTSKMEKRGPLKGERNVADLGTMTQVDVREGERGQKGEYRNVQEARRWGITIQKEYRKEVAMVSRHQLLPTTEGD